MSLVSRVIKRAKYTARDLGHQAGGRHLLDAFKAVGVPTTPARKMTRAIKLAASPALVRQRRKLELTGPLAGLPDLDRNGWLLLPRLPGADEVVAHCNALFEAKRDEIVTNFKPPFALVLNYEGGDEGEDLRMVNPRDFAPIVKFCSYRPLVELVASYMGEWPVLSNLTLGYTPANAVVGNTSQKFHRDMNHNRQLHLVMPIWPVDMDGGPFTFLPAGESKAVVAATQHQGGRLADEEVFGSIPESKLLYATGNAGDAYLIDPYACLHCGARTKQNARLVLIANYTSLFESSEGMTAVCRSVNRGELDDGTPETRMLLNI